MPGAERPNLATDARIPLLRHQFDTGSGVRIAYAEYRPMGPARADIVLVHGLASSGLQFHQDALHFAEQGFRILVPDLRGHGISGVPAGPIDTAGFAIPPMAADMIAMLDHARATDVHWVGNSLGGILALWLLGTPEAARLRSLALFGTCFSLDLPARTKLALRLAFLPGAKTTAWLTARTTTANPVGREAIAAAIKQFDIDAGAAIVDNVRNYDFVANARAYNRPLLVLYGGRDHAVNLGLRGDIGKFADRPNFTRIDLPQGGHCANFDMPDTFRAALEAHWARADKLLVTMSATNGEDF